MIYIVMDVVFLQYLCYCFGFIMVYVVDDFVFFFVMGNEIYDCFIFFFGLIVFFYRQVQVGVVE